MALEKCNVYILNLICQFISLQIFAYKPKKSKVEVKKKNMHESIPVMRGVVIGIFFGVS